MDISLFSPTFLLAWRYKIRLNQPQNFFIYLFVADPPTHFLWF